MRPEPQAWRLRKNSVAQRIGGIPNRLLLLCRTDRHCLLPPHIALGKAAGIASIVKVASGRYEAAFAMPNKSARCFRRSV
jgi:hypothetical protein